MEDTFSRQMIPILFVVATSDKTEGVVLLVVLECVVVVDCMKSTCNSLQNVLNVFFVVNLNPLERFPIER